MRITVHAYDRLGTDLVISVSYVRDVSPGIPAPAEFLGKSIVPLAGFDWDMPHDVLYALAEELLNMAFRAGRANEFPDGHREPMLPL